MISPLFDINRAITSCDLPITALAVRLLHLLANPDPKGDMLMLRGEVIDRKKSAPGAKNPLLRIARERAWGALARERIPVKKGIRESIIHQDF